MRFPLIPPDLADTHALRPVDIFKFAENGAGLPGIVARVVTEKDVKVHELPLRPGVHGEV